MLLAQYVQAPWILYLFVPFFFFFFLLVKREGSLRGLDNKELQTVRRRRLIFLMLRGAVFFSLFVALSSPFLPDRGSIEGNPRVTVLIDNSTSFDLYDRARGAAIEQQLQKYVEADSAYVGQGTESALGEGVMSHLERGKSILLVSDGQNNKGVSLEDVSLLARESNVSLNSLVLTPKNADYSVGILGPSKTTVGVEGFFQVSVQGTDTQPRNVRLLIDGSPVFEREVQGTESFIRDFPNAGYHTLQASIEEPDFFPENNIFYKSVKVVPKPTLAYLGSADSPLLAITNELYQSATGDLDAALSSASALVVNNLPAAELDGLTQKLKNYLIEGNGLVVFGGKNSFEFGGYKSSTFESLIPVEVGSAEKSGEDVSVVVVIDISGSTGATLDTAKSLAWSVIQDIKKEHFVGVVAFDTNAYTVLNLQRLQDVDLPTLQNDIASLVPSGGTSIGAGIERALDLLEAGRGGKNLILITDGQTQERDRALTAAQQAPSRGAKLFVVGVSGGQEGSELNEPLLHQLANAGGGSYFQAFEGYKLKLLFGEPDQSKKDAYGLFIMDSNHFITENLAVNANVYGFNEATPKPSALLLVTTDSGEPLIVVWRYGLGRIAVVLTDDGTSQAGELLNKINSRLLVRVLNWAVGDPERKLDQYVTITDSNVGEKTEITTKIQGGAPSLEGVSFTEVEPHVFRGYLPVQETGFFTTLGALHAVNSPLEYQNIGMSPVLATIAVATKGAVFEEGVDVATMIDALRQQSFQDVIRRKDVSWVFALAALVLFLGELALRRAWQYNNL